jgi:hypothetical protein
MTYWFASRQMINFFQTGAAGYNVNTLINPNIGHQAGSQLCCSTRCYVVSPNLELSWMVREHNHMIISLHQTGVVAKSLLLLLLLLLPGHFSWSAPLLGRVISFEEPAAVGATDWWGINYYSRPAISSSFKLVGTGPSEPLTGMGMPLVPGDLYTHLMQAHRELKVITAVYWCCDVAFQVVVELKLSR